MRNAREEFESEVSNAKSAVVCAALYWGDPNCSWRDEPVESALLHPGYSEEEYQDFLNSIHVNYYEGYGGQELFGTIWYADGTWSDRREYDGSEWWEHQKVPEYPEEFNTINGVVEIPILPPAK